MLGPSLCISTPARREKWQEKESEREREREMEHGALGVVVVVVSKYLPVPYAPWIPRGSRLGGCGLAVWVAGGRLQGNLIDWDSAPMAR